MSKITVVTIAKNEEKYIGDFLRHVVWADEVVVVDHGSTDKTVEIAKQFKINFFYNINGNLGLLKQFALSKATKEWILLLDVDELLSPELQKEIQHLLSHKPKYDAYLIPYTNHFLSHALKSKAQTYSKIRLFKKGTGSVTSDPVHEEVVVKGKVGKMRAKIAHYSFRSLPQTLSKFIQYARVEGNLYFAKGERATLTKFTLYPLHMFWSIFVEDEGWKDGIWGFGLAACFAYYEFMRYYFLLLKQISPANK